VTTHQSQQEGPKTAFGKWMVYKFIPQYSNNVYGLVYLGAGILIIVVGIRGLGTAAYNIPIIPKILMDNATKKIDANIVMLAIFLEFFLLCCMAAVTFFTPEDESLGSFGQDEKQKSNKITIEAATFQAEIEHLQHITNEEMRIVENYVNKLGENAKRLNVAKAEFFQALTDMRHIMKSQ
jgi:hypothetical protein